MRQFFFLISFFFLSPFFLSCQFVEKNHKNKRESSQNTFKTQTKLYEKSLKHFANAEYKESKNLLEALQYEVKLKSFKLLILYNLGRTYEALNQCKKAEAKYRDLIHFSLGEFNTLKAKGILRLGYVYECLGQDTKVIGSFLNVRKERKVFSDWVTQVEASIHLALAYARLNQWEVAKGFFESSEKAFQGSNLFSFLSNENHREKKGPFKSKKNLAQALYFVGNLNKTFYNIQDHELRVKSLKYMQKYLVKIFKTEDLYWSKRALKEIEDAYKRLWIEIQNSKSISQKGRKRLTLLVMKNLHQLKMDPALKMEARDFKFAVHPPNWFQKIFLSQKKLEWNQMKKNFLSFAIRQELKWTLSSDLSTIR